MLSQQAALRELRAESEDLYRVQKAVIISRTKDQFDFPSIWFTDKFGKIIGLLYIPITLKGRCLLHSQTIFLQTVTILTYPEGVEF